MVQHATQELFAECYDDLRRLAQGFMARERKQHTLGPTALVHETYVRMSEQDGQTWRDECEFYNVAAMMMRRVLMNYGKRSRRRKRGGDWTRVALTEEPLVDGANHVDLVALDEALEELERLDPRAARVITFRFYLGLTIARIAELQERSSRSVAADWALARAWLHSRLAARDDDDLGDSSG